MKALKVISFLIILGVIGVAILVEFGKVNLDELENFPREVHVR